MSSARERPASPRAALDEQARLYKTLGNDSKAGHRVKDCRAIKSSEKSVEPIDHPAQIPLRVELCREQDCWPEGGDA